MNKKHTFKKYNTTLAFFALLLLSTIFITGCKKDDFEGEIIGECPVVVSTDPMDKAIDVVLNKVISVTFNTDMDSTTINNSTLIIKQGTNVIEGTIAPTAVAKTFTFTPRVPLLPFTAYTGTVTTGAKDIFNTAMIADYTWTFTTIPQVALSFTPALSGTVSGAGEFAQGALVTVSALPSTGFTFTNWTVNNEVASTSASYQFTMAGNKALVANFVKTPVGQFAVNLSSSPVAGGTTTGSGAYDTGTEVTVFAAENDGYTFTNWTENGNEVSNSSSYQFDISSNRTLVANFKIVPSAQLSLTLSSSPAAGGRTTGQGSFPESSRTVKAMENTGYTFISWTDKVTGLVLSTSPEYTIALSANRALVANFAIKTYTLTVISTNGVVVKDPNQTTYNHGTVVKLTATPNTGYEFRSYTDDATGTVNTVSLTMNANKTVTANFEQTAVVPPVVPPVIPPVIPPVGPVAVNLGSAADFAALSKAGISTTGITRITGNIGVSPTAATAITGFGLIMDTNGQSSHTPIVVGKVYAADYAAPTPSKMTTAISDMETAFTTANGLTSPAPIVNLYSGDISGRTLTPGLYKWSTNVDISNAGVTLSGGPNDTWVFQIAQDFVVSSSAKVTLLGGAQAKNIFWVVTGKATLGTNSDVSGIILSKTLISLNTGAKVTGRLLAQTAITLNASTVTQP